MRYIASYFLLFALLLPAAPFAAGEVPAPVTFEKETLIIQTREAEIPLIVEIAKTHQQQMRGLQGRTSLERSHGMLFLSEEDKRMMMWMKDTSISLDMLFIDKRGQIVYIVSRTKPFSTQPISARFPVRAVLEIAGGGARAMHIQTGDRVIYPAFEPPRPRKREMP